MRSVTVAKFWPWQRNEYNSLPHGIDRGTAEIQRLLPQCIMSANQTNSVVRLLQDDAGVGRSPCTEPAHDTRSRLARHGEHITEVSEIEPGAKSNALAINDGSTCIMGREGTVWVSFCGVVSPKATSRGGRAAMTTAGVLTRVGSKTVPVGAPGIVDATLESSIAGVTVGTVAVAATGPGTHPQWGPIWTWSGWVDPCAQLRLSQECPHHPCCLQYHLCHPPHPHHHPT